MRPVLILFVLLFGLLSPPVLCQTTFYFSYATSSSSYPVVCSSGSLSCTLTNATSNVYNCTSVISGNHYYYPSATAPTFVSNLLTSLPSVCEGYTADNVLPITAKGLNLQFGSTCINLYLSGGVIRVSPDSRTGVTNFNYSTSASDIAACPAVIPTTSSSSAVVGFMYTITYNGTSNTSAGSVACGVGNLQCTYYGSNEYYCPTLLNGIQYTYNGSTQTASQFALSAVVECNSFGDGYLPLNYEGISFSGIPTSRGCTSLYAANFTTGSISINYNLIPSPITSTFTYSGVAITNPAQSCASTIPNLYTSSSTGPLFSIPSSSSAGSSPSSSSSSGGNPNGAVLSSSSTSIISIFFTAVVALLSL